MPLIYEKKTQTKREKVALRQGFIRSFHTSSIPAIEWDKHGRLEAGGPYPSWVTNDQCIEKNSSQKKNRKTKAAFYLSGRLVCFLNFKPSIPDIYTGWFQDFCCSLLSPCGSIPGSAAGSVVLGHPTSPLCPSESLPSESKALYEETTHAVSERAHCLRVLLALEWQVNPFWCHEMSGLTFEQNEPSPLASADYVTRLRSQPAQTSPTFNSANSRTMT